MAYTIAKDLMTVIYTSNPMPSVTQCFTGNELYLSERVLCDRQCMVDRPEALSGGGVGAADRDMRSDECNGPWYCARTEVCEMFVNSAIASGSESGLRRSCTVVFGCANHSQCFPDGPQADAMHIDFDKSELGLKKRTKLVNHGLFSRPRGKARRGSRRRRGREPESPRRRVAAPRPRAGESAETGRGGAAAAGWIVPGALSS